MFNIQTVNLVRPRCHASEQTHFHDLSSGIELNPSNEELPYGDYIFGTEGDDSAKLIGALSEDHLYGMAGNDTIYDYGRDEMLSTIELKGQVAT